MNRGWIRPLFYIAAFYDALLGILFLVAWRAVYQSFGVTLPNHGGYVQFPALLLIIFAALFVQIARNPIANRNLIAYGIGLKIAYSGIVFWYALRTGVPRMFLWCAWIDLAFLILFVVARQSLPTRDNRDAAIT